MTRLTLRLPDEVHEKLRWLSYTERRSQQDIVLSVLEKALEKVKVPKEGRK
jgi:predicted DNA-binding protein